MINNIAKNFKYPPLNYKPIKKIPDKLIRYAGEDYGRHKFKMVTTSAPYGICKMICLKKNITINNKKIPILLIDIIKANPRKQGLGTEMIKFAKLVSKKMGCEERLMVGAYGHFTPSETPHIFYRKLGFNTGYKSIDTRLDEYIATGQRASNKDFEFMPMYYPAIPYPEEKPIKQSFITKLKNLFTKIR